MMQSTSLTRTAVALIATFSFAAISLPPVASAQETTERAPDAAAPRATSVNPADPYEGFNRKVFAANNLFDETILVPAAKAYRAVTPAAGRRGLRRFLGNFRTPVTLINDILQGEFSRAGTTTGRFLINSTIGFGGIADPAAQMGLEKHTEDFGQTLAVWGVPSGPHLVLPFFGPSSPRDAFGGLVSRVASPFFYIDTGAADLAQIASTGAGLISAREPLIEPVEDIKNNSLDFYSSFRSFYMQARQREIANGQTDFNTLPDIGDFDDFDDIE